MVTIDSHPTLLAGASRLDITPPGNLHLDGFMARNHRGEGVHDPLYVTALALHTGNETAVIVALDLVDLTESQIEWLWRESKQKFNLRPAQLLFNCSHTHAGPVMREQLNYNSENPIEMIYPDPDYIKRTLEKIIECIECAINTSKPAKAEMEIGETEIGICRRAKNVAVYQSANSGYQGLYANYPNPDKEIDKTLPVLMFRELDNKPICLVFGAACHPTTMSHDNYHFSAEFPGVARRILEQDLSGAPALFLQGIGGDVKPRRTALEDGFFSGSFDDVEAVGEELAYDVKRTIERGLRPLQVNLRCAQRACSVPFNSNWGEATFIRILEGNEPVHRRVWAQNWMNQIRQGKAIPKDRPLILALIEISPQLRIAGISGEVLTDMGLKIKEIFDKGETLLMGYTNGVVSYIPDASILKEGGYEATEVVYVYHDIPGPWSEQIEDNILKTFDELQSEINSVP